VLILSGFGEGDYYKVVIWAGRKIWGNLKDRAMGAHSLRAQTVPVLQYTKVL